MLRNRVRLAGCVACTNERYRTVSNGVACPLLRSFSIGFYHFVRNVQHQSKPYGADLTINLRLVRATLCTFHIRLDGFDAVDKVMMALK